MSLYYLLLRGWMVLGRDEATIRALSAVAVVATVPLVYRLGAALVGSWAAAAGALLLATHPFVVRYGQEARGYAVALLCVVIAGLALVRGRWGAWIVASVLAAYAHLLTLLVVATQLLVVGRRVRLAPIVVTGVLVLPMLWFVATHDAGQLAWLGPPDAAQVTWVAWKLTGEAGWIGVGAYVAGMLLALPGGGGVRFLLAWAVLPFAGLVVVSFVKPLFLDRYLLMIVPALVLLAATGMHRLPDRVRGVAVAALVGLQLAGVVRANGVPSIEDWRGVGTMLRTDARPGDAVACWVDFACVAVEYYAAPVPIVWLPPALDDAAAFDAIATAHPRLWLALSHVQVGRADRTATLARIEAALATRYALADTREFAGVVVRRYERVTTAAVR